MLFRANPTREWVRVNQIMQGVPAAFPDLAISRVNFIFFSTTALQNMKITQGISGYAILRSRQAHGRKGQLR